MHRPHDDTQPSGSALEVCPDCRKETAANFMVDLTDRKDKRRSRRVCVFCFDIHQREHSEVIVDRTTLASGSLVRKKVVAEMWKLVVLSTLVLALFGVGVWHLVQHFNKKKELEKTALANAAGTPGAKSKDGSKPEVAGANTSTGQPKPGDTKKDGKKDPKADAKAAKIAAAGGGATSAASGAKPGEKPADPNAAVTAANDPNAPAKPGERSKEIGPDGKPITGKQAAKGDPKSGGKGKPGEDDPSKGGQTAQDASESKPEAKSAQDTIKEIQKMLPKVTKRKGASGEAPGDEPPPEEGEMEGELSSSAAGGGKSGKEKDAEESGFSKEQAAEMHGKLSGIATKTAPKLMEMASVAARLGEVAARFAPKTDLAGPIKRVRPRRGAYSESKDLNLDGGTGADVWDELMKEANASDIAAGRPKVQSLAGIPAYPNAGPSSSQAATGAPAAKVVPTRDDIVISATDKKTASSGGTASGASSTGGKNSPNGPGGPMQTQLTLEKPLVIKPAASSNAKASASAQTSSTGEMQPIVLNKVAPPASTARTVSYEPALSTERPIVIGKAPAPSPNAPAPKAPSGGTLSTHQPIVIANVTAKSTGTPSQQTLNGYLYFDLESHQTSSVGEELDEIMGILRKHPESPVFIQGYVDASERGGSALSQKRAEAAAALLSRRMGIPVRNMTAMGAGPLDSGDGSPDSQARNRRVRISVPNPTETKRL